VIYERVARPLLFRLEAERAHRIGLAGLAAASAVAGPLQRRRLAPRSGPGRRAGSATVFGIDFPSRIGLAAGLDKDGHALRAWPLLGFGFVEVGTVTAHAQPGNPAPRLFRLRADEAIVNRMGFNNAGAAALAVRLGRLGRLPVPLGISLGKSKVTPVAEAVDDYLTSLRLLHQYADYLAINVSSPNTPGLRSLQEAGALADLVDALVAESAHLAGTAGRAVPLLVKVAPDLTEPALEELVAVCLDHGVSGLIATNTTLSRAGLRHPEPRSDETGGLSGRPLFERAVKVVGRIHRQAGDRLPVIGVGGIAGSDDALRMLEAGAALVQIYSGLIYQGPALVRRIARALAATEQPASGRPAGTAPTRQGAEPT
jgi:dihydroorotate dehydrogenase